MHSKFLLHALQFGVEKCALQFFLEWEAVYSNIFGVDTFPLQNFSLPWSKQSCTQISLQKFGVHLMSTPKVLECTSSPLQIFGVHWKSTPKNLECTKCPLQKNWSTQNFTPKMSNFWSEQLPTPIFLEWTAVHSIFFGVQTCLLQNFGVHVVKVWSAFSLTQLVFIEPSFYLFIVSHHHSYQ